MFTWKGALFLSAVTAGGVAIFLFERQRVMTRRRVQVEESKIGKPKLGGPWTLYDREGRIVSDSDLRGKYQLIYFGFTFCPDICPQELEKQAAVIEKLDAKFGEVVQPVYVSVDPGRDTCAQVDAYCREFHPRLIGLTGTPAQIKNISKAFRVYYNEGIRTDEEDYLVDHSIIQYLMGKGGKFKEFFGKNLTVQEMADKISDIIKSDQDRERRKRKGRTQEIDDDDD